jgi:LAO/AO transport system kinase
VAVLDAMGYDRILVETVGVGQDEVDIVAQAHTAVVVTVPGLGDEIQAIKAGILEIADVLVVNKCDRDGADRAERDLLGMLELRPAGAPAVEIVRAVASRDEGIAELVLAIDRHRERVRGTAVGLARGVRRAEMQLHELLHERLLGSIDRHLAARGGLRSLAEAVSRRELDPYTAADAVASAVLRPIS